MKKLSKFPVTTDVGEYLVTVRDRRDVWSNERYMECKIYHKQRISILKPSGLAKVHTYMDYDNYLKRKNDIKKFVIDVVGHYEALLEEYNHKQSVIQKSIKGFQEWDGRI